MPHAVKDRADGAGVGLTCPHCGYTAETRAEADRHAAGLDRKRLHCPHQNIEDIKAAQRKQTVDFRRVAW